MHDTVCECVCVCLMLCVNVCVCMMLYVNVCVQGLCTCTCRDSDIEGGGSIDSVEEMDGKFTCRNKLNNVNNTL